MQQRQRRGKEENFSLEFFFLPKNRRIFWCCAVATLRCQSLDKMRQHIVGMCARRRKLNFRHTHHPVPYGPSNRSPSQEHERNRFCDQNPRRRAPTHWTDLGEKFESLTKKSVPNMFVKVLFRNWIGGEIFVDNQNQ